MNAKTTHRRQFLRGACGSVVAIPFLPSLAKHAQAAAAPGTRAFVAYVTEHGGLAPANMYPLASANQTKELIAGHVARFGPLAARTEGNDAVISPVLRAPASDLTSRLVGKMMVQRGLDVPFYLSHHWGGHLGNVAGNDGVAGGDQTAAQRFPNPTIDHVMGWSASFYPNLDGIVDRHVVFGSGQFSWGYSNPSAKSGTVQAGREQKSSRAVFDRILGGAQPNTPVPTSSRKPVVDKVLAHYKSLRESNARLSPSDRQRLDDYMSRIADYQRRLNVAPVASCGMLQRPAQDSTALGDTYRDGAKALQRIALINDVIAISVMCGSTRAFVVPVHDIFMAYAGDKWHEEVAHRHDQAKLMVSNNGAFRGMLDLAKKLDVDAGDGGTYLDRSLLHWSQESGDATHHGMNQPIVTFGSGGGFFKTGQYVDWQNNAAPKIKQFDEYKNPGLLLNRWHANIMLAMGVPKADWPKVNNAGFGHLHLGGQYHAGYGTAYRAALGDPLPIVTNG